MAKTVAQKKVSARIDRLQINSADIPEILGSVEYTYVNHLRISASKWDVRVAVGDLLPTGTLIPKVGIVMSHLHAKQFAAVLNRIVADLEERNGPITDPDARGAADGKSQPHPNRKAAV